jgi:hypothetical protein
MQGTSVFEGVDGLYVQPRDSVNPASNGLRIGLDNIPGRFSEQYHYVSISGRVQDCEWARSVVHSASQGEFAMIAGYCHYFNGPYIWVQDLRYHRGPPLERRTGSHDRKDYGDLEPAPEDWRHRPRVEALSLEFLVALRSNDRDRLAGMHFRDAGLERKQDKDALLDFLLRSRTSPFFSIRAGEAAPQEIILVEKSRLLSEPEALDDYSSIVCFCREENCSGRWPIASFDADNLPSRPYACTEVGSYLDGKRWVPDFTTPMERGGLAEPRERQ